MEQREDGQNLRTKRGRLLGRAAKAKQQHKLAKRSLRIRTINTADSNDSLPGDERTLATIAKIRLICASSISCVSTPVRSRQHRARTQRTHLQQELQQTMNSHLTRPFSCHVGVIMCHFGNWFILSVSVDRSRGRSRWQRSRSLRRLRQSRESGGSSHNSWGRITCCCIWVLRWKELPGDRGTAHKRRGTQNMFAKVASGAFLFLVLGIRIQLLIGLFFPLFCLIHTTLEKPQVANEVQLKLTQKAMRIKPEFGRNHGRGKHKMLAQLQRKRRTESSDRQK